MKRIFALLIAGMLLTPVFTNDADAQTRTASAAGAQIVVLDPPASFSSFASSLGYEVGTPVILKALEMTAVKISLPEGVTKEIAMKLLEAKFPDLMVADSEI